MNLPGRSALAAVPMAEWREIVVVSAVAAVVEVGIRRWPLPRLARRLGVPLGLDPVRDTPSEPARASARTVRQVRTTRRVMRHWPWGDTCLRHALVLGHRLRRHDPVLRVGVAKFDGVIKAHAWLEFDGRVLDPIGGARSYHVLDSTPQEHP